MNERAYSAFTESIQHVDKDPVRFGFTDEEVEKYDITVGEERGLVRERTVNLSEGGYPYMKAALIFEYFARETETLK